MKEENKDEFLLDEVVSNILGEGNSESKTQEQVTQIFFILAFGSSCKHTLRNRHRRICIIETTAFVNFFCIIRTTTVAI